MMRTNRSFSRGPLPLLAAVAILFTGCTVQEQRVPDLAGPSELGLGMSLTAAPEFLPRDGSSVSTITAKTFDSNGKPMAGQRLRLQANAGTLSASEVTTGTDGSVQFAYIAPGLNDNVSRVIIAATPVQNTHYANSNARIVEILVSGPDIPLANFTFDPADAAVQDIVGFDASTSMLDGRACGGACDYSWDFGDGSSGSGIGAGHAYGTAGVFNVTLTVTSRMSGTAATVTKPVRIAVPAAPEASFTFSPSSPAAGQNIIFSSTSVLAPGVTIVRHVWELDNGSPAVDTGSTPSYTLTGGYGATSTHQVTLTITDNYGRTSRSEPETVDIP